MRVGGRGVAVGEVVSAMVAVGDGSVGSGWMTSVAVAVDVGVVVGDGEGTAVGVQVGGSVNRAAMNVAVGSGGLNGLSATRGLKKIIA